MMTAQYVFKVCDREGRMIRIKAVYFDIHVVHVTARYKNRKGSWPMRAVLPIQMDTLMQFH